MASASRTLKLRFRAKVVKAGSSIISAREGSGRQEAAVQRLGWKMAAVAGGRACAYMAQTLAPSWLVRPTTAAAAAGSWARAAASLLPSAAVFASKLAAGGACGAVTMGMIGALDLQDPCAPAHPCCPAMLSVFILSAHGAAPHTERRHDVVCSPVGPA